MGVGVGFLAAGLSIGVVLTLAVIYGVLLIVGDWKLFTKAGKPGWHSIIPILNFYDEYDLCWSGMMGIVFCVASCISAYINNFIAEPNTVAVMFASVLSVITFVLHVVQSWKLAKAFGKGTGYFIFLLFFDRIAKAVLGLGNSQYCGKQ